MMDNRQAQWQTKLNAGLGAANDTMNYDASQGLNAYNAASGMAGQAAGAYNNAQSNYNNALYGTFGNGQVLAANNQFADASISGPINAGVQAAGLIGGAPGTAPKTGVTPTPNATGSSGFDNLGGSTGSGSFQGGSVSGQLAGLNPQKNRFY